MSFLTHYLFKEAIQFLTVVFTILALMWIPSNYYNEQYYTRMTLADLEQTLVLFNKDSKIEIPVLEFKDISDIRIDIDKVILELQSGQRVEHLFIQDFSFKRIYFDEENQNIVIIT